MKTSTLLALACVLGCGGDGGGGAAEDGGAPGADAGDPPGVDAGDDGCARAPAPADRTRYAIISHPYTEEGEPSSDWEVLALSPEGELTATGMTFAMGRGTFGSAAFTADGAIAVAAQEDGTLGIVEIGADGAPRVVESAWNGGGAFYASAVEMAPDSRRVFVLDSQWRENGGGVYSVALACDGTPTFEGLVAPGKLPYALSFAGDGRALVAAADLLEGSAPGADVHLVDLAGPALVAGADAFPDDEQIVASAALTAGGRHLLVGDNNQYYSTEGLTNRIAVVRIGDDSLSAVQTLAPIEDPVAIVASPGDDAALVVSGFGDAILELAYDPDADAPLSLVGEVDYAGRAPQLPGAAALIDRGALRGRVLVAELLGVRQLAFGPGGVTDLGLTQLGSGTGGIVGVLGVPP